MYENLLSSRTNLDKKIQTPMLKHLEKIQILICEQLSNSKINLDQKIQTPIKK